jgi:hypothetical protein
MPPSSGEKSLVPRRWKRQVPQKLVNIKQNVRRHNPVTRSASIRVARGSHIGRNYSRWGFLRSLQRKEEQCVKLWYDQFWFSLAHFKGNYTRRLKVTFMYMAIIL